MSRYLRGFPERDFGGAWGFLFHRQHVPRPYGFAFFPLPFWGSNSTNAVR